jgi:DNA-binding NtrC family response regulator
LENPQVKFLLTISNNLDINLVIENTMKNDLKILVIDDDADDRWLFQEAIQEINSSITCVFARDGMFALEMLNDPQFVLPDYIFLDLRMPRINGKRCLAEFKSTDRLKNIPVLIYTTSTDVKESEELKLLGAAHFISKPHSSEEIYYILTVVLEEQLIIKENNSKV